MKRPNGEALWKWSIGAAVIPFVIFLILLAPHFGALCSPQRAHASELGTFGVLLVINALLVIALPIALFCSVAGAVMGLIALRSGMVRHGILGLCISILVLLMETGLGYYCAHKLVHLLQP